MNIEHCTDARHHCFSSTVVQTSRSILAQPISFDSGKLGCTRYAQFGCIRYTTYAVPLSVEIQAAF